MKTLMPRLALWILVITLTALLTASYYFRAGPTQAPSPTPISQSPTPSSPRPNIVLISLDTVRPDHLSCYDYAKKTSPNLERFAAAPGSVLSTNARSQAPWTLPSHMSLMTSMLPSHNGVDSINQVLSEQVPTLAETLQENGYDTAALVNNGQMRAHWGFSRGFDTWREFEVDTPAGGCENIAGEAVKWLGERSAKPQAARKPYF